jgi:hypothetical protein
MCFRGLAEMHSGIDSQNSSSPQPTIPMGYGSHPQTGFDINQKGIQIPLLAPGHTTNTNPGK